MIFSALACMALILSICIKNRKKSLLVQSLNCLFESAYGFIIGAYTGAVLSIANFIRTLIFMQSEKINKRIYFVILLIFESMIITNCVYTWEGMISILPTIGSVIRTYCLWQSDMKLVRISGMTTGIFYGLYYWYYQSYFLVLGDIILLCTGMISIYKNDIKGKTINKTKVVESYCK